MAARKEVQLPQLQRYEFRRAPVINRSIENTGLSADIRAEG
jgi:hypothetical protein